MSESNITRELISKVNNDLETKKDNRKNLLNQLGLLDAEIDLIDKLIRPIDKKIFEIFEEKINPKVLPVKQAYDARIDAKCRGKYKWEKVESEIFSLYTTYKVVEDLSLKDFVPYYGIKYRQKPMDREYGSRIIAEFVGSVEDQNEVIAVTDRNKIPKNIQIGDIITDSLDSPEIFSVGDLPSVVGFGTTSSVGILTSIIGGIEEDSNIFYHFGLGDISSATIGSILSLTGILPDRTEVVGIGTGMWPIEYYDEFGELFTENIETSTLILNNAAISGTEESEFFVGILTEYLGIFLNKSASSTKQGINFKVLRIDENVTENFDYTSSPNNPLKIGIVSSTTFGVGNEVSIDSSGQPNITETWDPGSTYVDFVLNEVECGMQTVEKNGIIVKDITQKSRWDPNEADGVGACVINPEPRVGAGAEEYSIGDNKWPTYVTSAGDIVSSSYASPGQTIIASSSGVPGELPTNLGYASTPPGGFPGNCDSLDDDIEQAEKEYNDAVEKHLPKAQELLVTSALLRKEREKRQLYSWSILQATSKLSEEIEETKALLKELDKLDI